MSYTPTNWETGDTITAEKLNKLEQGVANAGGSTGGGVLVVNLVEDETTGDYVFDKTWQEIHDADLAVIKTDDGNGRYPVTSSWYSEYDTTYFIRAILDYDDLFAGTFSTDSADGYATWEY